MCVLIRDSVLSLCSVVVSLYVFGLFDVCVDVLMHVLFVHCIRVACFGFVVFVLRLRRRIVVGVLTVMRYYVWLDAWVFIIFQDVRRIGSLLVV